MRGVRRSVIIGSGALTLALGLVMWSVAAFIPRCVTYGVAPDERTCSSQPHLGSASALGALTLVSLALRIMSDRPENTD